MANRFSLEESKQLTPNNQLGGFEFERPTEGIEGKVFDVAEKVGGAVKTQFQESLQAQDELLNVQRNIIKPFYESQLGRKMTEEEIANIPVVDVFGAVGSIGDVTKLAPKAVKKLSQTPIQDIKNFASASVNFLKSTGKRIEGLGKSGKELITKITKATDIGEVRGGQRLAPVIEAGLQKLNKQERINLLDVLEGRAKAMNPNVEKVALASRQSLDDISREAQEIGVKTKIKTTLKPEDYAPKNVEPLAQEAKKYKSAEEFVNESENVLFHGTSAKEFNELTEGNLFLTKNQKEAEVFGRMFERGGKPRTVQIYSKPGKTKNIDSILQDDRNFLRDKDDIVQSEANKARKEGYRYIEFTHPGATSQKDFSSKVSLYPNEDLQILTKSQLTDFYNQVTRGGELPKGLTPFQRQQLEAGKKVFATVERPFTPREDYFPHIIPSADVLKSGETRKDIIQNLVRLGESKNAEEATKFLDDFVDFLDNGKLSGRKQSILDYMVKTGQASDEAEALANLQRFRQRTIKKQGSLEFGRQVDLPFYDPDPVRVLPSAIVSQSKRLPQIKEFGQANKEINKLIAKIRTESGEIDADFARQATDRILGIINDGNTPAAKASRLLRTLQGFKLGLAQIPNITQGFLNTLLASDLKAVGAGLRGIMTKQGKQLALRSGATLESTIDEALESAGAVNKALGKFLKATGFSATERLNRTFASNAGANIVQRLFQKLKANPADKGTVQFLSDLGIDAQKLLQQGKLLDDDILMAAKKFSDLTQFRSRPQDLPLFASTPMGKVFFQFKNFIYGQTRLFNKVLIGELRSGNYGKAMRNLLVLTTLFPLTGEAINSIRSIITGRKRNEEGLERYIDDITAVGAMGIFGDLLESSRFGQSLTESLVGPTISEAGKFGDIGFDILRGESGAGKRLAKEAVGRIPLAGQVLKPRLFPSKTEKKKGNRFTL